MKIAILSLYTEAHAPLNRITEPTKQKYADRWGYTFINHFGSLDESRPAAFSKIRLIQRHLGDFDWVYWIDADAAIMNPDISLKSFLCDYDLIIAQERTKSHYGNYQFNTGSFFLRNCSWSHEFLRNAYEQTQFQDHLYWEQAAMRFVLENDPSSSAHVYVETNPKRFNSFAHNYSKGDFVFHAVHFSTEVKLKKELLLKTFEEDETISEARQPDLDLYFLTSKHDDTHQLIGEFSLRSLIDNNLGGDDVSIQFSDVTPSVLWSSAHGLPFCSLLKKAKVVSSILREHEGKYLAFSRPDSQFLGSNWKRFCLVQLGRADGLFLENGSRRGQLGDAFFVVRATANVISYFKALVRFLETELRTGRPKRVDSFADLVDSIHPTEYGCDFKLFPKKEVQNIGSHAGDLEILFIFVHSVECVQQIEQKRKSLATIREAYSEMLGTFRDLRLHT